MDGDRLGTSGGSFSADITLSDGSTRTDSNWLAGKEAESRRLEGSGAALTRSVNWFTAAGTAGSGPDGAYFVGLQKREETLYGATDKTTRTEYEYDSYGNVSREILHGDIAITEDDRNVETKYIYNNGAYIVDRPLWSALWSGTTSGGDIGGGSDICTTYVSTDVPKPIITTAPVTVTSDVTVNDSGTVTDVNVLDLQGNHTWFGELEFMLSSPTGTNVQIMEASCNAEDNFDLNLDDEAAPGPRPCPPTDGGTYQPDNPLSAFDGEEMNGIWTLTVEDLHANDGGSLNAWSVEICTAGSTEVVPTGDELSLTMFAYDGGEIGAAPSQGNLTLTRAYSEVDPGTEFSEVDTAYDDRGRPISVLDANDNETTTTYHSFYGYPETVTNALNHVTSTVVNPAWGVATQVTDANNKVTSVEYDDYGRLTHVWLPSEPIGGPASLEYVYHPEARPAFVQSRQLRDVDTAAYIESWGFVDGFGRELQSQRLSENSGLRVVTSRQYNSLGQLMHSSAPYEVPGAAGSDFVLPNWVVINSYQHFSYDDLGRLTLDELSSGTETLWFTVNTYEGWTTSFTDANGHTTDSSVDAFGQLVQVTEYNDEGAGPVAYSTNYVHDLPGNLVQVSDHLGNVSTMTYDLLGRKTAMSDPDMGEWAYQYDPAGNLTAQQDGRGLWLFMEYDALNRQTAKRRDSASGSYISRNIYDIRYRGQLYSSVAFNESGTWVDNTLVYGTRDDRYRVTSQLRAVGTEGIFLMAFDYDEADNLVSVRYPSNRWGGLGERVERTFNDVGQLTQVVSQQDGTQFLAAASYEPSGQPQSLRLDQGAGGATISYAYEDGSLRLQHKQAGSGDAASFNLQDLSYGYDDGGNVTAITDAVNGGQVLSFGYDWLNRLTSASTTAVGAGQFSHTYAYDPLGNITDNNGSAYVYSPDQPHAVTDAFGNSYAYDANANQVGRTIGGVAATQVFDYENRLVEVQENGQTIASFMYDANGDRVLATVRGETTVYIDGLFEYQRGARTNYFAGVGGPVALRRMGHDADNGVFYLLDDHLDSTSVILNQDGSVSAQQYYFPFGGNRGGAFSDVTARRFTGQYHEAGLPGAEGLSFYNARWYDAQLGRFVSADTLVPQPANPQSLNRLSYVMNNPVRFTDPTGHCIQMETDGNGLCLRRHTTTVTSQYDASKPWIAPAKKTTYFVVRGGSYFTPYERMVVNYNGGLDLSKPSSYSWIQKRNEANIFVMMGLMGIGRSGGAGDAVSGNYRAFNNTWIEGSIPRGERLDYSGDTGAKLRVNPIPPESAKTMGKPGKQSHVRVVNTRNQLVDARKAFDALTVNYKSEDLYPGNPGIRIVRHLGDDIHITFRPISSRRSNYVPTIDVNIPGVPHLKIKFEPLN